MKYHKYTQAEKQQILRRIEYIAFELHMQHVLEDPYIDDTLFLDSEIE